MNETTALLGLFGGGLIGLGAVLLLLSHGRIAGISGITAGVVTQPRQPGNGWRFAFVTGLLLAGVAGVLWAPGQLASTVDRSFGAFVVGGLLVGVGTRLQNGCTSGHGVCGVSRLSIRSIIATVTFVAAGVVTVLLVDHLGGGLV